MKRKYQAIKYLQVKTVQNKIKIFENKRVRTVWNDDEEDWYFSVIDVIEILTETERPRKYWSDLKKELEKEGSELSEKIGQLKLPAADGKMRETDVLSTKNVLRLVQSIPSPKAEPFKLWLAQVGAERLDEIADPEKAILTNEMTKAWSGLSVKDYKKLKGLKKENLRDNMTNIELVLNMLAEVTTTAISKSKEPETFSENLSVAKEGGSVAKNARTDIEKRIGRSVISPLNASDKPALEVKDKEIAES